MWPCADLNGSQSQEAEDELRNYEIMLSWTFYYYIKIDYSFYNKRNT